MRNDVLTPKNERAEQAKAFVILCERMRREALEFRRTIRYRPAHSHPGRLTDEQRAR